MTSSPQFSSPPTKSEKNAVDTWAFDLFVAAHHERRALTKWRVERAPGGKCVLVIE